MRKRIALVLAVSVIGFTVGVFAQQDKGKEKAKGKAGNAPAPLAFKVDWVTVQGVPVEHPVDQRAVDNPNVELKLYGPSGKEIQANGAEGNPSNPIHIWTGLCTQPCGLTFRDKNNYIDMSGLGKIRWVTKVSGLHKVHPLLKLADGSWILGEHGDGDVFDYHTNDFTLSESRWIAMDVEKLVTRGRWLDKVDLSKVDEIGFTDLMPGSGHGDGGYTDVGFMEVYGKPIPRK
jgi:hypothetical protein